MKMFTLYFGLRHHVTSSVITNVADEFAAADSSETSITTHKTTWCHKAAKHNIQREIYKVKCEPIVKRLV